MYFETFNDFIAMGNHGLYVWLSYGVFIMVLAWNLVTMKIARRHALQSTKRFLRRQSMTQTNHQPQRDLSREP